MGKLKGAADGVPFKKGDARINRKGRPLKIRNLDELLRDVLDEDMNGRQAMELVLIALRKKAMAGDTRAAELLMDRRYGKLKTLSEIDLTSQLSDTDIDKICDRILNRQQ
ncbi:MAG TPA: DUF5681 domain-containing protein [Candidatus Paceibacterota bacterium]|jgi:hypothetical protein|nr:DUF5681 domain-containing protein [Candidatus Paceibacterota bacterium]